MSEKAEQQESQTGVLDEKLAEFQTLEDRRTRLVHEIIAATESDDLRTRAVLGAAIYVKEKDYNGRVLDIPEVTIRESASSIDERLSIFEQAVADPDTPVVHITKDYWYHPERNKIGILNGSVQYFPAKNGGVCLAAESAPDSLLYVGEVARGNFGNKTEEAPVDVRGLYIGNEAVISLLQDMQPAADNAYPVPALWDIAELQGVLAEAGHGALLNDPKILELLAEHETLLHKTALDMLCSGLVLTLSDEDERRGITSKPQQSKHSTVSEVVWDRDKEEQRLLTRTIPAVKVLGLGDKILKTIDDIDKPIIKRSVTMPSMTLEIKDPHMSFPDGMSASESHRREMLREKVVAII